MSSSRLETSRPLCWLALFGSIILEVGATTVMKVSQGHGFNLEALGIITMLVLLAFSYYLLAKATLILPVAVAFACWEGLGLALITLSSYFIVGEAISANRLIALAAVLSGVLLINYGTGHGTAHNAPDAPKGANSRDINTEVGHA